MHRLRTGLWQLQVWSYDLSHVLLYGEIHGQPRASHVTVDSLTQLAYNACEMNELIASKLKRSNTQSKPKHFVTLLLAKNKEPPSSCQKEKRGRLVRNTSMHYLVRRCLYSCECYQCVSYAGLAPSHNDKRNISINRRINNSYQRSHQELSVLLGRMRVTRKTYALVRIFHAPFANYLPFADFSTDPIVGNAFKHVGNPCFIFS